MASVKESKHDITNKSYRIRESTIKKLKLFDSVRGKKVNIPFWDMVVITASDAAQKEAYEIQLEAKLQRKELPLGVTYHVFSDPPGPKVGNGGSTIICIDELTKIHGKEMLSQSKILLAHAGGYSQRMPNASILGKVFTALPWGDPPYQMLEMLMAMFIEFPVNMIPGILLVCPDTFELFNTGNTPCCFTSPGFTALAHPSPIEIGTTHGVFVLDGPPKNINEVVMAQATCSKFLHKQPIQVMRDHNVVFIHEDEEHVYTDSIFFIDMTTAQKLHQLLDKITLDCEICAFGDFLQALGPNATSDYTRNVANVSKVMQSLVRTREMIFDYLKGTQLNVIVLNQSRFYHFGTTAEYIHHFCINPVFKYEASKMAEVFVSRSGDATPSDVPENTMIIHCHLAQPCSIGPATVLEYCDVGSDTRIGDSCIVSNVLIPENAHIPDRTFLMTVCVGLEGTQGLFVTVGYGIDDNMKTKSTVEELGKLRFFGRPLDEVFSCLGIIQDHWDMVTLWHAQLFPVFKNQQSSVLHTLEMIRNVREGRTVSQPTPQGRNGDTRLSMADVLIHKDVTGTLNWRDKLREKILNYS